MLLKISIVVILRDTRLESGGSVRSSVNFNFQKISGIEEIFLKISILSDLKKVTARKIFIFTFFVGNNKCWR